MKRLNNIKYLFLSLLFFTGVIFTETKILQPGDYRIETKNIEKNLHKLENTLDDLLNNFLKKIKNNEIKCSDSIRSWLVEEDYSFYSNLGFVLLAYENDSLKYWSDNLLQVSDFFPKTPFTRDKVVKLANGWFEVRKKIYKNVKLIGLVKIKNSFSFQNKYLNNNFREELEITSSVKISAIPVSHGKNIKDKNGEYVFSLVPVNKVVSKQENSGIASILYFLGFAFLLLYFNQLFYKIQKYRFSIIYLIGISGLLLTARFLMMKFKFPFFVYSFNFYENSIYGSSGLYTYLGDFVINSMFILFFAGNIFRIFCIEKIIKYIAVRKFLIHIINAFFIISSSFFLNYIAFLISELINNSTIPFEIYKILEVNLFTIFAYLIIAILITSYIFFIDKYFKILSRLTGFNDFLISYFVSILIVAFLHYIISPDFNFIILIFFSVILFSTAVVRFFKKEYRYYTLIFFIFISSIFITSFVYSMLDTQTEEKQKVLIFGLEDVRDDVAELLLHEIDKRLPKDTILNQMLVNIVDDHKLWIHNHLERKYFYGFWEKYKLIVTVCGNSMFYRETNQADYCEKYFRKKVEQNGELLGNTIFYFYDNTDGTITYYGSYSIPAKDDKRKITVYIQLTEKLVTKTLGYPELLLDNNANTNSEYADYSYAKYSKGKLVSKSGNYPYNLSDKIFKKNNENSFFVKLNGHKHHIFNSINDNTIVISKEIPRFVDFIISFAYLFVFLNLCVTISILINNHKFLLKKLNSDFKNKIRFSFFLLLVITFVFFGAGTIFYAVKQHNEVHNKAMSEKIQSVLIELEHKLKEESELTPAWKSPKYDHLDELLIKFSQVFFSDINLYSLNGFLLATSRSEIFHRGLIGKQINQKAYTELALNNKAQFIQNESIGTLNYASVYIPFKNSKNQIIAYINLPFFGNDFNFQKNISDLLITTINIYVVLFLITIVITFFISTKITQPLRLLQDKFKNIELGKKHQAIIYNKKDEIGELVSEYNKMMTELETSVKKLAESERESAWREMAKQIAHEIKNPLTPMKLSIQLLLRSHKDKKEDFDKRLYSVSKTVIEQIDTLSAIASEFSAFAKMPKAQNKEVTLISKLKNIVRLFENSKDIDIYLELNKNKDVKIIADSEQLSRVFINIIKNGIQSIPEGIKGKIYVELITYANHVKIMIEDNGTGIPESKKDKLFKPSFTTKTKGMGMGLAIVKNIVLNANGEIWFESEEGKGTKFFVEFPLAEE